MTQDEVRETPLTDDAAFDFKEGIGMDGSDVVDADFARSLERALYQARDRIERALLPDPHDERDVSVDWLRKEIREALAAIDKLKGGD
jgi:predicted nuclease with TOPRIM domain